MSALPAWAYATAIRSPALCARIWPNANKICHCAIILAHGSSSPMARPISLLIRAIVAGWGRLTRLLTLGNLRAEKGDCTLYLDDLLAHAFGLDLIAMGGPAQLVNDACARLHLDRVRLAASMLYRGRDRHGWRA